MPVNLRIETADGSCQEEYRIHGRDIEVRSCSQPMEFDVPDQYQSDDEWHRMTAEQLSAHVQANTVLAQWLRHRIGWRRLVVACTDPQTLETFGVSGNSSDNNYYA
jgi:uncharacterized Rossmann fold enzyme